MARSIVKLQDGENSYYMEWSSVTDSPITYGMEREEFLSYYMEQYGDVRELEGRMARVDAVGTSSLVGETVEDMVSFNRAGPDETSLDMEGLLEQFCRLKWRTRSRDKTAKENDQPRG